MKFLQLLVVLSVLIVTSCTVQKRHFNKGWNIEWNTRHHTAKSSGSVESEQDIAMNSSSNVVASNSVIDGTEASELIRFSSEPVVVENSTEAAPVVKSTTLLKRKALHQLFKPKKPKLGQKNERTPAGKINFILGPASAALILGGWVTYFTLLTLGISSYAWIPILLVGFVAALGVLYFSTRAEKQIAANPGKFNPFTGKNWAYIAFGIIVVGLLCGAFIH